MSVLRYHIGELIAQARYDKGLSLRELEKASGVCYLTIYHVENGHTAGNITTIERLATALNMELVLRPKEGG